MRNKTPGELRWHKFTEDPETWPEENCPILYFCNGLYSTCFRRHNMLCYPEVEEQEYSMCGCKVELGYQNMFFSEKYFQFWAYVREDTEFTPVYYPCTGPLTVKGCLEDID